MSTQQRQLCWSHVTLLTGFDCGHALPDALDHASALMAQNAREKPFCVSPTESMVVCVAHTTGQDLPGDTGIPDPAPPHPQPSHVDTGRKTKSLPCPLPSTCPSHSHCTLSSTSAAKYAGNTVLCRAGATAAADMHLLSRSEHRPVYGQRQKAPPTTHRSTRGVWSG